MGCYDRYIDASFSERWHFVENFRQLMKDWTFMSVEECTSPKLCNKFSIDLWEKRQQLENNGFMFYLGPHTLRFSAYHQKNLAFANVITFFLCQ